MYFMNFYFFIIIKAIAATVIFANLDHNKKSEIINSKIIEEIKKILNIHIQKQHENTLYHNNVLHEQIKKDFNALRTEFCLMVIDTIAKYFDDKNKILTKKGETLIEILPKVQSYIQLFNNFHLRLKKLQIDYDHLFYLITNHLEMITNNMFIKNETDLRVIHIKMETYLEKITENVYNLIDSDSSNEALKATTRSIYYLVREMYRVFVDYEVLNVIPKNTYFNFNDDDFKAILKQNFEYYLKMKGITFYASIMDAIDLFFKENEIFGNDIKNIYIDSYTNFKNSFKNSCSEYLYNTMGKVLFYLIRS